MASCSDSLDFQTLKSWAGQRRKSGKALMSRPRGLKMAFNGLEGPVMATRCLMRTGSDDVYKEDDVPYCTSKDNPCIVQRPCLVPRPCVPFA